MSERIFVEVKEGPVSHQEVVGELSGPQHGAQSIFMGVVRNRNQGRDVLSVEYDAFRPLTLKIFKEIAEEALERWGPDLHIRLIHAKGLLKVGEASVGIAVASIHRDESFQASRYIIEELKKRAPIWKREFYEDGETDWIKGHALCCGSDSSRRAVHAHGAR